MARGYRTWLNMMVASLVLAAPAQADPLRLDAAKLDDERLTPGIYPAAPVPEDFAVPAEPGHPPVELDWSIGLKGSYSQTSAGNSFVTTLTPQLSATHQGVRTDLSFDAGATLVRETDGMLGVTGLDLDLTGTTRLDRDTSASGTARLSLSKDLRSSPDLDPEVTDPPLVVTGALSGALDRRFGRLNLGLAGALDRTVYGPSTRTDTGLTDNGRQNVWQGDTSLRLGFQATPIVEIFGEASLGRDWFDQGTNNATSRSLRAGIAGNWNGMLAASASIGLGQHDFDHASLSDITTRLYDASLTFTPDPTLNLTALLSTSIEPTGADSGGTARLAHTASAELDYTVNAWLRLRASANWRQSWLEGSGETERGHGLAAGADYALNRHTAVSADYGYSHRDNSATGTRDSHTVSLGVTVRR